MKYLAYLSLALFAVGAIAGFGWLLFKFVEALIQMIEVTR